MAEPVPAPTAEEIETVVDITMLSTATVTAMLSAYDQAISNAKWAATRADIALWADIRDDAGDIKRVGTIEFFEGMNINSRLGFRNRIRLRYGQLVLANEDGTTTARTLAACASVTIINDY